MTRLATLVLAVVFAGCSIGSASGARPRMAGECTGDVRLYVDNQASQDVRIAWGRFSPLRSADGLRVTEYILPRGHANSAFNVGVRVVRGGAFAQDVVSAPRISCNEATIIVTPAVNVHAFGGNVVRRQR